ncbi:hypothetical protein LTR17_015174 [Elasticomyces elasticus]|nr:hypothetical protein LTR17_015174 [Elasticomyces elasticus]
MADEEPALAAVPPQISAEVGQAPRRLPFLMTAAMKQHSTRLFHTASGSKGLGPKITRPGGIVTVMRGGYVPLILRPLREEYQLLGQAYVSGIMQGEAVQQAKN